MGAARRLCPLHLQLDTIRVIAITKRLILLLAELHGCCESLTDHTTRTQRFYYSIGDDLRTSLI